MSFSLHWRDPFAIQYSPTRAERQAAERYIEVCQSLIDLANIERSNLELRPRNVKICFDEWNVWDKNKGNAKNGLEQWYDYTDMLGFVAWLHILVRKHKEVAIACLAQSVNVVSASSLPRFHPNNNTITKTIILSIPGFPVPIIGDLLADFRSRL